MPIPQTVRLFHITAIGNLAALCRAGALLSKAQCAAAGVAYQNIAHGGAQGVRAAKRVALAPVGLCTTTCRFTLRHARPC